MSNTLPAEFIPDSTANYYVLAGSIAHAKVIKFENLLPITVNNDMNDALQCGLLNDYVLLTNDHLMQPEDTAPFRILVGYADAYPKLTPAKKVEKIVNNLWRGALCSI